MNIETVNELIQSLESAGELSIKEQKYLELARAFTQLAAENASMRKTLGEVVYSSEEVEHDGCLTFVVNPDYVNDAADLLEGETPATDRIVAGIKADGVEEFAKHCDDSIGFVELEDEELYTLMEEQAHDFAKQLREGDK